MKRSFPLHRLEDQTFAGFSIRKLVIDTPFEVEVAGMTAHRDNHYVFFIAAKGSGNLIVDFEEVCIQAGDIYYILPSQIRMRTKSVTAEGSILAVDIALIPQACRNIFENKLFRAKPLNMGSLLVQELQGICQLLYNNVEHTAYYFNRQAQIGLLNYLLNTIASFYDKDSFNNNKFSRKEEITKQFTKLLSDQKKINRSPSNYAAQLNISPIYLNECLKETTGFSVRYWIQQELVVEAKRLLYYSSMSVKEIAHSIGFEDHSYFSRMFRKNSGQTAEEFRKQYLK